MDGLARATGFKPCMPMREGISGFVAWYRESYGVTQGAERASEGPRAGPLRDDARRARTRALFRAEPVRWRSLPARAGQPLRKAVAARAGRADSRDLRHRRDLARGAA